MEADVCRQSRELPRLPPLHRHLSGGSPAAQAFRGSILRSFKHRFFSLAACAALGLGAGYAGFHLTGNQAWFLALPAALVAGWFVVADPTKCLPLDRRNAGIGHAKED
jgi:hypothetical protein